MKHSQFFQILICLIFSLVNNVKANDDVVVLGTKVQWKPYHIDTIDGADGIAVRAFSCIMARLNQPYIIRKMPWKRVQYETKQGKLDGFFSASQNSERDSYATLSKVFLPQKRSFYFLKEHNPKISTDVSQWNKELFFGARAGSNALKSLLKNGFKMTIQPQTEYQLLKLLDMKRVDAVLENNLVFESLLKRENRLLTDFHKVLLEEKNMGAYFSHSYLQKHPTFMAKFNDNVEVCSLISNVR